MYRVNYNQIAPEYDRRFTSPELEDRGNVLLALAGQIEARRILEVGCGTAHWLSALHTVTPYLFGLDLSTGMLQHARKREVPLRLIQGSADRLPLGDHQFDLVYCVDAIHHFADPAAFIARAYALLDGGGVLAIIGTNPHQGKEIWYAYEYFSGMYETDLQRFPTQERMMHWMTAAGFANVAVQTVERIEEAKEGRAVLDDPFLRKNACSQMALLSEEVYRAGINQIVIDLADAEARGQTLVFHSMLSIDMCSGHKPKV